MLQYVLNTSTNVLRQFCPRRRPATWISREEHLPSFLAVAHHNIAQEKDNEINEGVMFGELMVLLLVLRMCMGEWECMCE